jgi:hypothetical protein
MPNQCPSWKPPPGFSASGAFADLSRGFFRVMGLVRLPPALGYVDGDRPEQPGSPADVGPEHPQARV